MKDPNLPPDYIDNECPHDSKFSEKGDDGLWFCTECEKEPEDFEEADFTGASDELGFAPDR